LQIIQFFLDFLAFFAGSQQINLEVFIVRILGDFLLNFEELRLTVIPLLL